MKKSTKIVIGTVLTLGVVGGVAAFGGHERGWHRGEHMISHVRSELDLSAEQTAALEALRDQIVGIRDSVRAERGSHRQQMLALISGTTLDQQQALQLVQAKTETVNAHAPEVIAALAAFYDGLTAEQQAKVREHLQSRGGRHWH